MSRLAPALLAALVLAAPPASAAEPSPAAADPDAARAALEAADRSLNRAARERDREGFRELLARDSVFLAGELHRGRLAVLAVWQHLFDGKYGFRYEAETLDVAVARSGELGWAVGSVKTRFERPGTDEEETTDGHYLHLWERGEEGWRLAYAATLVVHPTLGAARDPRGGLMTAWPELEERIGAEIEIRWRPEVTRRADSGELAYTFGTYRASFTEIGEDGTTIAGEGYFLAAWQRGEKGYWQLVGEGFTPPGIYGE